MSRILKTAKYILQVSYYGLVLDANISFENPTATDTLIVNNPYA